MIKSILERKQPGYRLALLDKSYTAPLPKSEDAQSHHSMSLNLEPEETPADSIPEPGVASTEVPEHVTEGGPEPSVPAVGAPEPTPTEGGLEPSAPAVGAPEPTPTEGVLTHQFPQWQQPQHLPHLHLWFQLVRPWQQDM